MLPFEFTPMYCGIPINPKDSIPRASGDIIPTGYVSPNGFNSKLVAHTPESNVITVVTRTPAHLSDISGKLDNSFVHTYIHTLVLDILMNVHTSTAKLDRTPCKVHIQTVHTYIHTYIHTYM